ncbi:MAG: S8 family serine peptidase [Pseudomonadota bacterium]
MSFARILAVAGAFCLPVSLAQAETVYPYFDTGLIFPLSLTGHQLSAVRADDLYTVPDGSEFASTPYTGVLKRADGSVPSTLGQGVKVGVIGGGYNPFHPELRNLTTPGAPRVKDVTSDDNGLEGYLVKCRRGLDQTTRYNETTGRYDRVTLTKPGSCDVNLSQHDTMVLSIIGGIADNQGVTGLAPAAELYYASTNPGHDVAGAIGDLMAHFTRGDIILIEAQGKFKLPDDVPCDAATAQRIRNQGGPAELDAAVFRAVKGAVSRGVIVVQGAGNSGVSLDPGADYDPANPTSARCVDAQLHEWKNRGPSGALIVGASTPDMQSRLPKSNYGTRVDVFSVGRRIPAAGYSYNDGDGTKPEGYDKIWPAVWPVGVQLGRHVDCRVEGTGTPLGDQGQYLYEGPSSTFCPVKPSVLYDRMVRAPVFYTLDFGGTSGSSAVIAGLLATVQSAAIVAGTGPKTAQELTSMARWTGYDRLPGAKIGFLMSVKNMTEVAVTGRLD